MSWIFDFMLLSASGAAVTYCLVLSRKLEGLKNTEKGLGATIATMSQTVEQARSAVEYAKQSSTESINELKPLVEQMLEIMPKVAEMIDMLSNLQDFAKSDIKTAAENAAQEIDERLEKARIIQKQIAEKITELDEQLAPENNAASQETETVTYFDDAEQSKDSTEQNVAMG